MAVVEGKGEDNDAETAIKRSKVEKEETLEHDIVPKIEEESDHEASDDEGSIYNLISNVKVTIDERVDLESRKSKEKTPSIEKDSVDCHSSHENFNNEESKGHLVPKKEPQEPDDTRNNLQSNGLPSGFWDLRLFTDPSKPDNDNEGKSSSEPGSQKVNKQCELCFKTFSTRSAMICHVRDIHEKSGDFECSYCQKRFHRNSAFIVHLRKHTGEKPFVCETCGKAFDRKSALNFHTQTHGERYPCNLCEKTFSYKKGLQKHVKYVHDKVKNFCCEICSKTFGRKEHLTRHFKDIHEEPEEGSLHQCGQCASSFKKEQSLKLHIRFVHENERNFVCDTCAKAFSQKASLDRHIADVHEQSGSNACQFCEKRFYKIHALKIHERSHTDEKPFACSFCDKKYHRSLDRDAHERKHTGEKPYQCEFCEKTFFKEIYKRDHERKHTGEKPFLCEQCGESFVSKYRKMKHEKLHEGSSSCSTNTAPNSVPNSVTSSLKGQRPPPEEEIATDTTLIHNAYNGTECKLKDLKEMPGIDNKIPGNSGKTNYSDEQQKVEESAQTAQQNVYNYDQAKRQKIDQDAKRFDSLDINRIGDVCMTNYLITKHQQNHGIPHKINNGTDKIEPSSALTSDNTRIEHQKFHQEASKHESKDFSQIKDSYNSYNTLLKHPKLYEESTGTDQVASANVYPLNYSNSRYKILPHESSKFPITESDDEGNSYNIYNTSQKQQKMTEESYKYPNPDSDRRLLSNVFNDYYSSLKYQKVHEESTHRNVPGLIDSYNAYNSSLKYHHRLYEEALKFRSPEPDGRHLQNSYNPNDQPLTTFNNHNVSQSSRQ